MPRLFSLWIVQSWHPFRSRTCKKCNQPIQAQSHAITCNLLGEKLASDYSLPPVIQLDPLHPHAESRLIEAQLCSILMRGQPREVVTTQLEALGGHLCRSLEAVYGPLNRDTYN